MITILRHSVFIVLLLHLSTALAGWNFRLPNKLRPRRQTDDLFNITFYHVNDIHAHVDQYSSSDGTDCNKNTKDCVGGYARIKAAIDQLRPANENSLFLNAGDEFQGTMFYTYYKSEKIAEVMNQMGFDAFTLGNHDFDGGLDTLGDFVDNLTFPVLSANIQFSDPRLNTSIKPYHIFEEYNLAVIGVTTTNTPNISDPGEGTVFSDPYAAVQRTIDYIKDTTSINRFAALTHVGYGTDIKLAQRTSGLHLIMGGHTHSLLGDMAHSKGPYPTVVKNKDGEDVYVLQAYRWGEYLGSATVQYDRKGRIVDFTGSPHHLTTSIKQNSTMEDEITAWAKPFREQANNVIGETTQSLDVKTCGSQECALGNLMADAMLSYCQGLSRDTDLAYYQSAMIKNSIKQGQITQGAVYKAFPTAMDVVQISVTGDELWTSIEGVVSGVSLFDGSKIGMFFQVSHNVQVDYNPAGPVGRRLVAVRINGEDLDRTRQYNMATLDITAGGGNNILEAQEDVEPLDSQADVLMNYVKTQSPIQPSLDGRIRTVNSAGKPTGGSHNSGSNLHVPWNSMMATIFICVLHMILYY